MENLKQETGESEELKELLNAVTYGNRYKMIGWVGFGVIFFILNLLKIYLLPWIVPFSLFLMSLFTYGFNYFVLKGRAKKDVIAVTKKFFLLQVLELMVVLMLIHISGITPYFGALVVIVYSYTSYFTYTRKEYRLAVVISSVFGYMLLIFLEYLGILKAGDVLGLGIDISNNFRLFTIGIIPNTFLMIFLFMITNFFSGKMFESIKQLSKKEKELEEARGVLEIKVKSRTQALEEEKNSLEKKVQERTKELQDKVKELEKFQKISIGRELKMIELKKEIDGFKK